MAEKSKWGWEELPVQVTAGAILLVVAALGSAIWPPARRWLLGQVWMPGWVVSALIVAAAVAGLLFGLRIARRRALALPSNSKTVDGSSSAGTRATYTPSIEEESVIRILRLADAEAMSATELALRLPMGTGVRDVELWAGNLKRAGFVRDYLNTIHGQTFTLADRGVAHAQQKGYPVGAHMMRNGFRLVRHGD